MSSEKKAVSSTICLGISATPASSSLTSVALHTTGGNHQLCCQPPYGKDPLSSFPMARSSFLSEPSPEASLTHVSAKSARDDLSVLRDTGVLTLLLTSFQTLSGRVSNIHILLTVCSGQSCLFLPCLSVFFHPLPIVQFQSH